MEMILLKTSQKKTASNIQSRLEIEFGIQWIH